LLACAGTPAQLVGVYLDGFSRDPRFSHRTAATSTVLVVTEDVLSETSVAALGAMHARLATDCRNGRESLRSRYIPRRRFRRFDPDNNCHPCIQRGSHQLLTERARPSLGDSPACRP